MPSPAHNPPPDTLPIVQETLELGRERVETGAVRVRVDVDEITERLKLQGWSESVEVERRPIGRTVEHRSPARQEGDVLVVPLYEERVVVQHVLVLTEELRVRKHREPTEQDQEVRLRTERATVERRDAAGEWHAEDDSAGRPQAGRLPPPPSKEY